jgi:hypothetical protein
MDARPFPIELFARVRHQLPVPPGRTEEGEVKPSLNRFVVKRGRCGMETGAQGARICWRRFWRIRSEWMLVEQLDYNLLFRWFVGLSMDDKV